ncbi:MAG: type II secretion system protein GspL [Gammaproteobacteria bacterium]|nr:type II secretion system protein GspL [Gammaproteobacteria bacterium]
MVDKIIVRFGEINEWLVCDGDVSNQVRQGTPDELAAALKTMNWQGEVVVLVPGEKVLLTAAAVPSRQQRQIMQAVPNVVEEQLALDIDDCHFAIGDRNEAGEISVAVVSLEDMYRWQSTLSDVGVKPTLMYSDTLTGPWTRGISITVDGKRAHFRSGKFAGFTVPSHQIAFAAELIPDIEIVDLYAGQDDLEDLRIQLAQIEAIDGVLLNVHTRERGGNTLNEASNIEETLNLLQGEFQVSRETRSGFRVWQSAAILAVCTFLLHVSLLWGQGIYLQITANRYAQDARTLYREVFPNDQNVRDVRRQWDAHLSGSGSTSGDRFIALLSGVAANLSGSSMTVNNISYSEGRGGLTLQLTASRSEQLLQFSQTLNSEGFAAEIGTISQVEDNVRGSIKIGSSGGS